ncbi:hypothetical protein [Pseudooceanicola sp.]|uniref:hypothetical protein n=1 Tax=Pseudooceanicola sp. TaxID=1914328 RepID=UPI0040587104
MTTETYPGIASYTVAGTGPYEVGAKYTAGALRIRVVNAAGASIYLDGDDFSVSPEAGDNGDVTLTAGTATEHAGSKLYIERDTSVEQGWKGLGGAREAGLEAQLDLLALAIQELRARVPRVLRRSPLDNWDTELPTIEADHVLAANADGTGLTWGPSVGEISSAADWAAIAQEAAENATALFGSIRIFDDLEAAGAADNISAGNRIRIGGRWFTAIEPTDLTVSETVVSLFGSSLYAVLHPGERVTAVLEDTRTSMPTGAIYYAQSGYAYEVAPPDATDHHATTAGGVKIYARDFTAQNAIGQFRGPGSFVEFMRLSQRVLGADSATFAGYSPTATDGNGVTRNYRTGSHLNASSENAPEGYPDETTTGATTHLDEGTNLPPANDRRFIFAESLDAVTDTTSFDVVDATGMFEGPAILKSLSELIYYKSRDGNTLNGVVRGFNPINQTRGTRLGIFSNLTADIDADDTDIPLIDATPFASSGEIELGDEVIPYTGKSGNTLTGATRGVGATAHSSGAEVRAEPLPDPDLVVPHAGGTSYVTGALAADLSADATVATLANAGLFATSGAFRIAGELIPYTGKSGNTLTGLSRGVNAAAYITGTALVQGDQGYNAFAGTRSQGYEGNAKAIWTSDNGGYPVVGAVQAASDREGVGVTALARMAFSGAKNLWALFASASRGDVAKSGGLWTAELNLTNHADPPTTQSVNPMSEGYPEHNKVLMVASGSDEANAKDIDNFISARGEFYLPANDPNNDGKKRGARAFSFLVSIDRALRKTSSDGGISPATAKSLMLGPLHALTGSLSSASRYDPKIFTELYPNEVTGSWDINRVNAGSSTPILLRLLNSGLLKSAVAVASDGINFLGGKLYVDGNRLLDAWDRSSFTTRGAAMTWSVTYASRLFDGMVITAGGLKYERQIGATIIPDWPGWRPFGTWDWGHFGVEYAGAADNTAKMQAAVTAAELLGQRVIRSTGLALRWDDEVTFTKDDWHFDFGSTIIKGQQWDDWGAHNGIDFAGSRYAGMLTGRGTAGITTALAANVNKGSRVLPLASTTNVSIGDGLELRSATELWYSGETATGEVFDGDGSTTVFNLSDPVIYEANFEVYVDDEELDPDDYTVSGTTLTFDVAPAAGTENIEVLHYGYTRKLEGLRIVDVDTGANTVTVDAPTRFSYDVDNHAVEVFTWKPVKRPTIIGGHWEGCGADHDGYTNGFGPAPLGLIGAVDFEVRPRSIKGFPGRAFGANYSIDGLFECYDIEGLPEGYGAPAEGEGWSGYYGPFFGRSHRITARLGACKRVRHSADGSGSHDCRIVGANCIENHRSVLTVHEGCDGWVYERFNAICSSHYGAQWRGGSVKFLNGDMRADPDGGNEYGITLLGGRASDLVRVIEIIDDDIDANYSALYLTAPNLDVRIRGGAHSTDDNAFPAYLIGCPSVAGFSVRHSLIDAGGSSHCIRFSDDALAEGDFVFIDDNRLIGATDVPVDVQSTEDKVNIRAKGNLLDPTMKAVLRYDARSTNSDGPIFDVGPNYSGTDVIWREDQIGDEDNFFDSGNFADDVTVEVGGTELVSAGGAYTVNTNYQRDGRAITFVLDVTITSFGTLSASGSPIRIKGLPFNGVTTMNQTLPPVLYSGMPDAWAGKPIQPRVTFASGEVRLYYADLGSSYNELKPTDCQAGCAFRIGGTYQSNTWS